MKTDVVEPIVMKIRHRNILFWKWRRICCGHRMNTSRPVWSCNLREGMRTDIDGHRIVGAYLVDCRNEKH